MKRRLAYLASVAIVLAGIGVIPMPFVTFAPGAAIDIGSQVTVTGQGEGISGQLSMLTVSVKEARLLDIVRVAVDEHRDLFDRDLVIEPGTDTDEHFAQNQAVFQTQLQVSATAALRALGRDVGARQVVQTVAPDAASEGILQSGDVLLEVDGVPVDTLEEVRNQLESHEPGDQVVVRFERDDEPQRATVELARLPGTDRVGLGITLATVVDELPIDVDAAGLDEIGGPSAGLVLALAIHDLLSPADIVDGRRIAVTGTVDVDGRVGNIGGMRQKVVAAESVDAELMIVPIGQVAEARAEATSVEVVGVRTLDEALAILAERARS